MGRGFVRARSGHGLGIVIVLALGLAACSPHATQPRFASADDGRGQAAQAPVPAPSDAAMVFPSADVEVVSSPSDPMSILVLVTKTIPLDPIDFAPPDLVALDKVPTTEGASMRAEAAAAMTNMYDAAVVAGVPFAVNTAYRSFNFQSELLDRYAAKEGLAAASRTVAKPGYSEHQTGLAADLYDTGANKLSQSFGSSPSGLWIAQHAYEFGFIISYPKGKESVTGYIWEPWHVRYVGIAVSAEMHEQGIQTLQEYLGE